MTLDTDDQMLVLRQLFRGVAAVTRPRELLGVALIEDVPGLYVSMGRCYLTSVGYTEFVAWAKVYAPHVIELLEAMPVLDQMEGKWFGSSVR